MRIRPKVRVVLTGLILGLFVSGCQTQGASSWDPSSPQQANTEDTGPQRISQEFYLPFYDQTDHLKSLIDENKTEDADRLYVEQKAFFDANRPESLPTLTALAEKLNSKQSGVLQAALNDISKTEWPAPSGEWSQVKKSLSSLRSAVQKYPTEGLLSVAEFKDERVGKVEKALKNLESRIKNSSDEEFERLDHFGSFSIFDIYPVELDIEAVLKTGFPVIRDKLSHASTQQFKQFSANYDESLLGEKRWAEISNLYIDARLRELGETSPDIVNMLGIVNSARELGFKPKSVPGLNIGFIEVTSKTLLNQGQIDFPATIDIDLPVETSKADLNAAFDRDLNKKFDYLIIFDVALAKASRRVLKMTPVRSTLLAGYRDVDNPDYAIAQQNVEIEKINLNQAAISAAGYHGQGLAAVISQWSASSKRNQAQKQLQLSMQALSTTPKTIKEAVHQDYTFRKATIDARKNMTVHYYVIDQRQKTYFKSTFDVSEKERFDVAYNIDAEDLKKKENTQAYATEKDVDDFEKEPSSVKVSQLVNHYIANRAKSKKLNSLLALRKQMLKDKNIALATYKANTFDARPLNDPRFDSVVVVYTPKGLGSGFFVKPDIVLTNWHVVENSKFVELKTYDGQETFGKVIGKDVRLDLALVQVQSRGKPVRFYTKNKINLGETVEAIGHPKRFEFSISRGIISSIRKHYSINLPKGAGEEVLYLQSDVAINTGNSGGPMFLGDRVIGVNTWGRLKNESEGLNFAVHYSEALAFMKEHLPGFRVLTN